MYHLHLPAIPGPRGRAAVSLPFYTLEGMEAHCAKAAKQAGEMRYGWTSQIFQRAICPPKGEHSLSKGGEIKITVGSLQGRHTLSWIFSGPDSLDNANAVG